MAMITKNRSILLGGLMFIASACDQEPTPQPTGDVVVTLNLDEAGAPFGDLFRSVNLDAGKQMNKAEDYSRIERLMCPDPTNCTPGPVRFWDKVNAGRFALESPISNEDVLQELHARGFPIFWSMMGVPAFLRETCTGCVVEEGDNSYHFLREVELSASDPKNPLNVDID